MNRLKNDITLVPQFFSSSLSPISISLFVLKQDFLFSSGYQRGLLESRTAS